MDGCPRKAYPTDLTDEQWALAEPLILAYEDRIRPGPERTVDLRDVTNTLLYQNRTGCQWAFLPHDLLPKSTVYDYFTKWRDNGLFQRIVEPPGPHGDDVTRQFIDGTQVRRDTQRKLLR